MAFASLQFLGFCLIAIVLLRAAPLGWGHQILLAALSTVFAFSFVDDPIQLLPLVAFGAGGYIAVLAAVRLGTGAGLGILITVMVFVFGWLRHYAILGFVPALPFFYVMVGLPYILMRVLHLMVDVSQGVLQPPSPLRFFNYNFSFLTFVSGPIQRYESYEAQLSRRVPVDGTQFHAAICRLLLGYLMISVFSVLTAKFLGKAEPRFYAAFAMGVGPATLGFYVYTALIYFAHLYFNFVGYMHIVIGVGLLAGFALPENFNHPLKSENFLDLWSRWHMTLGDWFKLYVFNPVMKLLAASGPSPRMVPYLGAIAYFVTFFLLGLWHGSTVMFVICGLVIGAGVTVNKLWQTWMAARLGRQGYRALRQKRWYMLVCRAFTLGYFAFMLTTLWADDTHLSLFTSAVGLVVLSAGLAVMTVLALMAIPLYDHFVALTGQLSANRLFVSDIARAAWSGGLIFLLCYAIMHMNAGAPDFIYKGF